MKCVKGSCKQYEMLRQKRARARLFRKVFDWLIVWGIFILVVVGLVLLSRVLNADSAVLLSGGALGLIWCHLHTEHKFDGCGCKK